MSAPIICVADATKTYGRGEALTRALDGVSLDIHAGEFVAIVGTSGAGKSTLINLIAALDIPTTGSVMIGGKNLGELREADLARLRSATFGFVFQGYHLISDQTLLENVLVGSLYRDLPLQRRIDDGLAALEAVGLGHRAAEVAKNLSGGQQQRVAIARALVSDPPVIVADEPTGNLDSETSAAIMRLLARIAESGTTVIVVTHDPDVAARAHRLIRVEDGRVAHDSGAPPLDDTRAVRERPGSASILRTADLWRDAYANVTTSLRRLIPFVLSLALAVALVVTTVGLTVAAQAQVEDAFNIEENRQVTAHADPPRVNLEHMAASLTQINGVVHSGVARTQQDASVIYNGEALPQGTPVAFFAGDFPAGSRQSVTWAPGASLETMTGSHALVGRATAETMGLSPLWSSPVIEVNGFSYVVVGIIDESPLEPDLVRGLEIPAPAPETLARIPLGSLSSVTARIVTGPGAAPQVASQTPLALSPADPDGVEVIAPAVVNTQRARIESNVRGALLAMSALSLFTSFFMLGSMSISSVRTRRAEFGVRRAMGARRVHLARLMVAESILVGVAGGFLGLFFGIMAVYATSIVRGWTPVFDWWLSLLALVLGIVVSMVASLMGVVAALRIQPADALRR